MVMQSLRVLVTGGSGDLGRRLAPRLQALGAKMISLDPLPSGCEGVETVVGTILDRNLVQEVVTTSDVVVHVAAWHGYHAFTKSKSAEEFWDTNMTGTFNLLEACAQHAKRKCIFMSSTSIDEWPEMYGMTKMLGEELCRAYMQRYAMQIICLRPRAFIPWWNTGVYSSKAEWAAWFARGAVHIDDVAAATISACHKINEVESSLFEVVELDGKHDFDDADREAWRRQGRERFLIERFPQLSDVIRKATFLPATPPTYKDLRNAQELLGYLPSYGYKEMLEEIRSEVTES
ncbi:MAG: NAD(P)-dependent oxidoreductase [Proteobacteria bacterium]|nr:NAD(P)-dependent oxidoreductase [Pseudomonadota bacterium]